MNLRTHLGSLTIFLVFIVLGGGVWIATRPATPVHPSLAISEALPQDTVGYQAALGPVPLVFPQDHGPHPGYKLEWWYLTGNLMASSGRSFGYQFTVFRTALAPPGRAERSSTWATDQLYMAHFTITDVQGARFAAYERFARGAAGLAGAQPDPFRVWVEDWTLAQQDTSFFPLRVQATAGDLAIDLTMTASKPLVLQGERGFSPKGPLPGQASYYYSFTRLQTDGTLRTGGQQHAVAGESWLDREWSTSLLGPTQQGWDWFSLQLDDGRELMYFVLREDDPDAIPHTDGLLVRADGSTRRLARGEVQVDVKASWESPHSGAVYPASWQMQVPDEGLSLVITPVVADQELNVSVRYWEGAVRVGGHSQEGGLRGKGYVEMTGYGQNRPLGR